MVHLRESDRLIDAAEAVFKEHGYPQARIEDIAAALGLQKASLYRHVESKAELLFLVTRRDIATRVKRLVAILADSGSARVRLEFAIREHLEYDLGDLALRQLVFNSWSVLSPGEIATIDELHDEYAHLFRRIVQDAVETGVARSDLDVPVMTRFVIGMLNVGHTWYRPGRLSKDEVLEVGVGAALGAFGIASVAAPAMAGKRG